MEKIWKYLQNQFLVATRKNFKKALKLSNYHDALLKKAMNTDPDPDWAFLYNRYNPLHLAYTSAYTAWKNAGGTQEGQTLNLDQLLLLLVTKVDKWDVQVQNVFGKTSPDYKKIFPDGRAPFNSGAINTRIIAVQTLGVALTPYAALAAVKTLVDAFYILLDDARDVQEGAKGGTKTQSEQLDQKRIPAMTMQYGNLGFLMNKYMNNPLTIAPFFELAELRGHQQVLFTGTLDPAENEPVLIHTFVADDEIRFQITIDPKKSAPGKAQAEFYLATSAGGTDSTAVVITAGAEQKLFASAFGITDYGTHRYLTAINPGSSTLDYEIELL